MNFQLTDGYTLTYGIALSHNLTVVKTQILVVFFDISLCQNRSMRQLLNPYVSHVISEWQSRTHDF